MNNTPCTPLFETRQLNKTFSNGSMHLHVLKKIDLAIFPGQTLALVGESGCGKSTLGKILLRLEEPSSGALYFEGNLLSSLSKKQMLAFRQKAQIIFQDPYTSLNPRMRIEEIVAEGLAIHNIACANTSSRQDAIIQALSSVNLDPSLLKRYPHELSGGQRQRIAIARALIIRPKFIVCDESLSALDKCTQRHVMNLLLELKQQQKLSYLFISHDLQAAAEISDRIAVMYFGKIVESAPKRSLQKAPLHPYTQALFSAAPLPDPQKERSRLRIVLPGEPPSPFHPPKGCPFHPRCAHAMPACRSIDPPLIEASPSHFVSCHLFSSASHQKNDTLCPG